LFFEANFPFDKFFFVADQYFIPFIKTSVEYTMGASGSVLSPELALQLSEQHLLEFNTYQEEIEELELTPMEKYSLLSSKYTELVALEKAHADHIQAMIASGETAAMEAELAKFNVAKHHRAVVMLQEHELTEQLNRKEQEVLSHEMQLAMDDIKDLNLGDFDSVYTSALVQKVFHVDNFDYMHPLTKSKGAKSKGPHYASSRTSPRDEEDDEEAAAAALAAHADEVTPPAAGGGGGGGGSAAVAAGAVGGTSSSATAAVGGAGGAADGRRGSGSRCRSKSEGAEEVPHEVHECHLCSMSFETHALLDVHMEHSDLHRKNLKLREKRIGEAHKEAIRLTNLAKNVMHTFYMNIASNELDPEAVAAAATAARTATPDGTSPPAKRPTKRVDPEKEHHKAVRAHWKKAMDTVLHNRLVKQFEHLLETRIDLPRSVEMLHHTSKYFYRNKTTYDLRYFKHTNHDTLEIIPHFIPLNHETGFLDPTVAAGGGSGFLACKRIYLRFNELEKAFFGYRIRHTELTDEVTVADAPTVLSSAGSFKRVETNALGIFVTNRIKIHKSHAHEDALFFDLHGINHDILLKSAPETIRPMPLTVKKIEQIWHERLDTLAEEQEAARKLALAQVPTPKRAPVESLCSPARLSHIASIGVNSALSAASADSAAFVGSGGTVSGSETAAT
jgi:hypothetical protein